MKASELRRGLWIAAALAVAGGLGLGALRTRALEQRELDYQSEFRTLEQLRRRADATGVSARVGSTWLPRGSKAWFELCARGGLEAQRWAGALELAVWQLEPFELLRRVPLDDEHLAEAQRDGDGACLLLATGTVRHGTEHAIDAVWPDQPPAPSVMQVPLSARIIARTPLGLLDRLSVGLSAAGALLLLLTALSIPAPVRPRPSRAPGWVLPAVLAAGAASWLLIHRTPLWGSSMGLLKGVTLLVAEVGIAWWAAGWIERGRARALALPPPARPLRRVLPVIALVTIGLVASARVLLELVPATGEAPIQTFVAWPSGLLSFALLGVMAPLGEELFFRGLIYRAALRWGGLLAFGVAAAAFVLVHLQQVWGNWGGLSALVVTSVALTGLRAWSGSVLVPAATHLLYNLTLSLGSL